MPPPASICYAALASRDRRFDGVFFTRVRSTGIFCRPICPTRTPRLAQCTFFDDAIAAGSSGFRPCLRCRPELSPDRARHIDDTLPGQLLRFLRERAVTGEGIPAIARAAGYGERQFRRQIVAACGVPPVAVSQWERLLLAKRLLHETALPVSQVGLTAGFQSVRRFNASFRRHLQLTPGQIRRDRRALATPAAATPGRVGTSSTSLRLNLAYRPPLAWRELCQWLRARATRGVEVVGPDDVYARTFAWAGRSGWLTVRNDPSRHQLVVEISPELVPALAVISQRVRCLFDLDAQPARLAEALSVDPLLRPLVARHPGLRVPGAWDVFETAVRVILGQQITVAAATTLAGRLAQRLGQPIATPIPGLTHLGTTPAALDAATVPEITRQRAETLRAMAAFAAAGGLNFAPSTSHAEVTATLRTLPGIGPWTAEYIALRALRFPDAFPSVDLGLRQALGQGVAVSATAAASLSERWRPWRAYAAAWLWQSRHDLPISKS